MNPSYSWLQLKWEVQTNLYAPKFNPNIKFKLNFKWFKYMNIKNILDKNISWEGQSGNNSQESQCVA